MTNAVVSLPVLDLESDLKAYIRKISAFPMLEAQEEQELAMRLQRDGDVKAAEKLVTSHLRLVVKIAYGFKNYGLSMMDIISEGNIGLMKAVKKFDVSKGFRLSTYAMWWIKAQIQEYVLRSWSLVKIGTTVAQKKLFFNLNKLKNKILDYDRENLGVDDVKLISNELGVSENEVKEMTSRMDQSDVYLFDKTSNDEESNCLIDNLASTDANQEELYAERQEQNQHVTQLYAAIETLKDREKEIIMARKLTDAPKTLEELSIEYGISKERVRQIEARALEKIQEYFNA